MARFRLLIRPSVGKDLRGVPSHDRLRILSKMEALREDPRPPGAEKLAAQERYRVRQGNYRILYLVHDEAVIVEVVKVGHRREVYRNR